MKSILVLFALIFSFYSFSQKRFTDFYKYSVNLDDIVNDRIGVTLSTPSINSTETGFVFPISVPGYYNINLKFGDLISNFQAFDGNGKLLPSVKKTSNRWLIKNATRLKTIKYEVDDVWEVKDSLSHWLPAEYIFEENKVFLLNQGATMGYFEGMEHWPLQIQIKYPKHLYPATGADIEEKQKGLIRYSAKNYQDLTDEPIFYNNKTFKI